MVAERAAVGPPHPPHAPARP